MITYKTGSNLLLSDVVVSQTWWKRVEVRLHVRMCHVCSHFARQLGQFWSGARHWSRQNEGSAGLEERLIQRFSAIRTRK
jgi:hypothetical protein